MKPRRRPRLLVVPRYIAQRAVSWHKTLTPAQKDPSLGQSAPSYRIRDINGNRWNAHVCYGGLYVRLALPYRGFTPTFECDRSLTSFDLTRLVATPGRPPRRGRVLYETGYRNFGSLQELYDYQDRRRRYRAV